MTSGTSGPHTSKGVDAEGEKEWYQDWDIKRD